MTRPHEALASAGRLLLYALRGGQEDALREIRAYEALLEPLNLLGADVQQRVRDAAVLEMCGMRSQDIPVIARVWASGRLDAESAAELAACGIQIELASGGGTR